MQQPKERNRTRPFAGPRDGPAGASPSACRPTVPAERQDDVLKVSTRSRPSAVAGAIAGVLRQVGQVEVQAIGAGARNQAVKAIAMARASLHEEGLELAFVPTFKEVRIETQERTALRLLIERRPV
jgi:stage V sporulation protein S